MNITKEDIVKARDMAVETMSFIETNSSRYRSQNMSAEETMSLSTELFNEIVEVFIEREPMSDIQLRQEIFEMCGVMHVTFELFRVLYDEIRALTLDEEELDNVKP